jgi:sec-independent protein translocase protein TatC
MDSTLDKYLPYLYEIRKRLLFLLSVFSICAALGFIYYAQVVDVVLRIFKLDGVNIVFTSPFQFLSLAMTSGLLVGVSCLFPLIIWQFLSFIKPALRKDEYRVILALLPLSLILFAGGFSFGIVIMRYIIILFYEKSISLNIGNFLDISELLSQILFTAVLMGLAFQFPIILTALLKLRLITAQKLKKQRPVAYSIALVFAALLPPSDLISLILLTLPLIILFEITILFSSISLKTKL